MALRAVGLTASTSISTLAACGYVNPNGTDDRRRIGSLYRRVNVVRKPGSHGVAVAHMQQHGHSDFEELDPKTCRRQ